MVVEMGEAAGAVVVEAVVAGVEGTDFLHCMHHLVHVKYRSRRIHWI